MGVMLFNQIGSAKWQGNPWEGETFEGVDRNILEWDNYKFFMKPWNYEKSWNANRQYPLVVYMHGAGHRDYMKNRYFYGAGYYDINDNYANEYGANMDTDGDGVNDYNFGNDWFRTNYPCFTLFPRATDEEVANSGYWEAGRVVDLVENFADSYRINKNRIYISGWSRGGNVMYEMAEDYYSRYNSFYASIVRLNGSGTDLSDAIYQKTAICLTCGVLGGWYSTINTAYNNLIGNSLYVDADITSGATRTADSAGYQSTNYNIVEKTGMPGAMRLLYPVLDHYIETYPFRPQQDGYTDVAIFDWIFSKEIT